MKNIKIGNIKEFHNQFLWKRVNSNLADIDGNNIFTMEDIEVPDSWTKLSSDILIQKYIKKTQVPLGNIKYTEEKGLPLWLSPADITSVSGFGTEVSAKQVFHRLAGCWTYWGYRDKNIRYFNNEQEAWDFYCNIFSDLYNQVAAPNSPQWFNTGLSWAYGIIGNTSSNYYIADPITGDVTKNKDTYKRPLVHACFLTEIEDSLDGIMEHVALESKIFKMGAGSGTNYSPLRGKGEKLSGGGESSGLLSFLKIPDTSAGAIKSGGTTRRSARMMCLNVTHPETNDIINWKVKEEYKVASLVTGSKILDKLLTSLYSAEVGDEEDNIVRQCKDLDVPESYVTKALDSKRQGIKLTTYSFDTDYRNDAYNTVTGQNSNNSILIPNKFMQDISSQDVTSDDRGLDNDIVTRHKTILYNIALAAWNCADPGLLFEDTINEWHTCLPDGRINTTNPCCIPGYMFVDTSEGRISFEQLYKISLTNKKLPYSFSFNEITQIPELKQINKIWIAGKTKKIIRIHTDKGLILDSTIDHPYNLFDGRQIEATNLKVGMCLRKITRGINKHRSNLNIIYNKSNGSGEYQSKWMWEQINGKIPEGYYIDHIDGDLTNDHLSNLQCLPVKEHMSKDTKGKRTPRYIDQTLYINETIKWIRDNSTGDITEDIFTRWNEAITHLNLQDKVPKARSDGKISGINWDNFKKIYLLEYLNIDNDDKVSFIETITLDKEITLYDMEVADNHNFAFSNESDTSRHSIIVHNSEYLFLNNTSCNLASHNLMKFVSYNMKSALDINIDFDYKAYSESCKRWTMVLELSVLLSQAPSKEIAKRTYMYRTLGLGYSNLGTLLMAFGLPYDSVEGRSFASTITSIMTGSAYLQSSIMAKMLGPFSRWLQNKENMLKVIRNHIKSNDPENKLFEELTINPYVPPKIWPYTKFKGMQEFIDNLWDSVLSNGNKYGYRNAQVSLLAPTGTISLLMGCDTTGVEPEFSIAKDKLLAGGGSITIINNSIELVLKSIGYTNISILNKIMKYIEKNYTIEGCPELTDESHIQIFDCAIPGGVIGKRSIKPYGHIMMMAAIQPFISGAISKTINMPKDCDVYDIEKVFISAHKLMIKAIAIYRNNSKLSQPLSGVGQSLGIYDKVGERNKVLNELLPKSRRKLPSKRKGYIQKVKLGGTKFYLHTGEYKDGTLGEIFVDLEKEGVLARSLLNQFAIALSLGLQYGVPLEEYVDAFIGSKFEPNGVVTEHLELKMASSITDLIMKDLAIHYLKRLDYSHTRKITELDAKESIKKEDIIKKDIPHEKTTKYKDACYVCGKTNLQVTGTCKTCADCGTPQGGCS